MLFTNVQIIYLVLALRFNPVLLFQLDNVIKITEPSMHFLNNVKQKEKREEKKSPTLP